MMEFQEERRYIGNIPVRMLHPVSRKKAEPVVLYHGWGSSGKRQLVKGALLAAFGYTAVLLDAAHHGEREPLEDYYTEAGYTIFWETVFSNIREFGDISEALREEGYGAPWVMGHSMGGITVMGIARQYGERIRGAVSFNGSGDWALTHLFMQARFGADWQDWPLAARVREESPLSHLEEMAKVPIFMANGAADTSVDPRAQAHFAGALAAAGGKGCHVSYPGLGHFVTTNMMDDALSWMEARRKA